MTTGRTTRRIRTLLLGAGALCLLALGSPSLRGAEPPPEQRGRLVAYWTSWLRDEPAQTWHVALLALPWLGRDAAPPLVEVLASPNPMLRARACRGLAVMGAAAKEAVKDLAAALSDADPEVRAEAVDALAAIGPEAEPATPELLHLTSRRVEPAVQERAWWAIARIGRPTEAAVQALAELAPSSGFRRDRVLVELAANLGSAALPVLRRLEQDRPGATAPALLRIAFGNPPSPEAWVLYALGAQLASGPYDETLGEFTDVATEGVQEILTEWLAHTEPSVRAAAAAGFGWRPDGLPAAASALSALLADEHPTVRAAAARALATTPGTVRTTAEPLHRALAAASGADRLPFALALSHLGPDGAEAAPALAEALSGPDPTARIDAEWGLARLGVRAHEAVPALQRRLNASPPAPGRGDVPDERPALLAALAASGAAGTRVVVDLLADPDEAGRQDVVEALAWAADRGTAVAALEAVALETTEPPSPVSDAAVRALTSLGAEGAQAIARLLGRVDERRARTLFNQLPAEGLDPAILVALAHGSAGELPSAAIQLARGFGGAGVGALRPLLASANRRVRDDALSLLVNLGPAAWPDVAATMRGDSPSGRIEGALALLRLAVSERGASASGEREVRPTPFATPPGRVRRPRPTTVVAAPPTSTTLPPSASDDLRLAAELLAAEVRRQGLSSGSRQGEPDRGRWLGNRQADLAFDLAATLGTPEALPLLRESLAVTNYGGGHPAWGGFIRIGRASIPVLIAALSDPALTPQALQVLARFGRRAREAAPAIRDILADASREPDLRRSAAGALARLDPSASDAVPLLLDGLGDPDRLVGVEVERDFAALSDEVRAGAAPLLRQALSAAHGPNRIRIALLLASCGTSGSEATPILVDSLASSGERSEDETRAIIDALRLRGAEAVDAVPLLLPLLDDRVGRGGIVEEALVSIGEPAVEPLVAILTDDGRSASAARALAGIGVSAVPALLEALAAASPAVQAAAMRALSAMGTPGQAALAPLRARFGAEPEVRAEAAIAILSVGGDDEEAIAACLRLLSRGSGDDFLDRGSRRGTERGDAALAAFGAAGPHGDVVLPVLLTLILRDEEMEPDGRMRAAVAVRVLLARGQPAAWTADGLAAALRKSDGIDAPFRAHGRADHALLLGSALARLGGPMAMEGFPVLADRVRRAAAWDERRDGFAGEEAVRDVLEAIEGLGALGPAAAPATGDLVALVSSPFPVLRASALRALGRMGPAAAPALEAVQDGMEDEDGGVRFAAVEAAASIRGK